MNELEIMNNELVNDTLAEQADVAKPGLSDGAKFGLVAVASVAAWELGKKLVNCVKAKIKAKREQKLAQQVKSDEEFDVPSVDGNRFDE